MLPTKMYRLVVKTQKGEPFLARHERVVNYARLGTAINAVKRHRDRGREATIYEADVVWRKVDA